MVDAAAGLSSPHLLQTSAELRNDNVLLLIPASFGENLTWSMARFGGLLIGLLYGFKS